MNTISSALGLVVSAALLASQTALGGYAPHKISNLPGWNPSNPTFDQYAGYVTVNESHGRALFYWLTESEKNPSEDPLVIWLNGGPGCSSVGGGLMSELGPFYPHENGTLVPNPWAWNQIANLLFIESPAGVGFSYSNTSSDYKVGDKRTSEDLYTFLVRFLQMYPEFQKNPVYISGVSCSPCKYDYRKLRSICIFMLAGKLWWSLCSELCPHYCYQPEEQSFYQH
eukprot:gb/GECG01014256.1/.p1 GENE.gb/GECG01014256.1/~~gb/GECG01014256.1/.p1  ORF type:complete len:226 (+),score=4.95 gb/GECG01014256.1/:1-678(+)